MGINNFPERFEILKVAINRCVSDGVSRLGTKSVRAYLRSDWKEEVDPRDPVVIKKLKELEALGVIKFIGTDECYFQIIKQFEQEPREPRIL